MRDLLINNGILLVWIMVAFELLCGILCLMKSRKITGVLMAIMCFGLAIDAFIIGIGSVIGEGNTLQGISQVRYILHGMLVPTLVPIAFHAFGIKKKIGLGLVWGVTGLLIICGIVMGFMIKTEPETMAGILRYATSDVTPAFATTMERVLSIGGVIPLIVVGIIHVIKNKKPFLLLSGVFMFAFSALAPATGNMDLNFLVTMLGEAFMVLFFWLELKKDTLETDTHSN